MSTGVQHTPFPLIDKYLVIIDQWMGFHTQALLNWTYAHPRLQSIFVYCYSSLGLELVFLPLIVAALGDKSAIQNYFLAFVISYIIGMTIYYFIPTAGPTVIFKNPHFLPEQHDTFLKFFEIHHRILLTTTEGGMIAFPSFHVLWACFMVYLCRHHKWLFFPILVLNIGIIASTVFLGWHYLTDVIGGILLAIGSIYWAHKISRDLGDDDQVFT
jgi:membrane-associated phospholipid phosphatase